MFDRKNQSVDPSLPVLRSGAALAKMTSVVVVMSAALGVTAPAAMAQTGILTPNPNQPLPRSLPPSVIKPLQPPKKTVSLSVWTMQSRGRLRPRLDWKMPPRYGLDQNRNGTIDLPNSLDYVMNRRSPVNQAGCKSQREAEFTVNFQSDQTQLPRYQFSRKTTAQINAEKARLEQQGLNVKLDLRRPQAPKTFYSWKVEKDGRTYISRKQNPTFCLPEGKYKVTLSLRQGKQSQTIVKTVPVIDYLIVLLGDSYGAGEGAPEKLIKLSNRWKGSDGKFVTIGNLPTDPEKAGLPPAHWADHGLPIVMTSKTRVFNTPKSAQKQLQPRYIQRVAYPNLRRMMRQPQNRMYAENFVSHRSSYTHASQLAIRLERSDPRSSVTFINLAQSGATIYKGMLGSYAGVSNEPTLGKAGVSMSPQVTQLKKILGQRSADDLFMSIGGNDMGFANILALFAVSHDDDAKNPAADPPWLSVLGDIKKSFEDGAWNRVGNPIGRSAITDDRTGKVESVSGRKGMMRAYGRLHDQLSALRKNGQIRGDIHLILPPFPGSAALRNGQAERIHTRQPRTYYCRIDMRGLDIPGWTTIDWKEMRWAKRNILPQLYKTMRSAVSRYGWKAIEPGNQPFGHGMCGGAPYRWQQYNPQQSIRGNLFNRRGVRWFRTPQEGANLQAGDLRKNKGLFHPNELGYRYLSQQLEQALGANPIRNRGNRGPIAKPWDLSEPN